MILIKILTENGERETDPVVRPRMLAARRRRTRAA